MTAELLPFPATLADLRASFVAQWRDPRRGESKAISWFPESWVAESRTLIARNSVARDWLNREARAWLRANGLTVATRAEAFLGSVVALGATRLRASVRPAQRRVEAGLDDMQETEVLRVSARSAGHMGELGAHLAQLTVQDAPVNPGQTRQQQARQVVERAHLGFQRLDPFFQRHVNQPLATAQGSGESAKGVESR